MAVIGNGAQCEFQAIAFRRYAASIPFASTTSIQEGHGEGHSEPCGRGLKTVYCSSSEDAVEGADIITTCTADKQFATIFTDNMVGPGVHINAIGGDGPGKTELHRDILTRSRYFRRVRTPDPYPRRDPAPYCRLPAPTLARERGEAESRRDAEKIQLFDSVGFAIEDFSALRYVHDKDGRTQFFEILDMLADPDDPRICSVCSSGLPSDTGVRHRAGCIHKPTAP